MFKQEIVSLNVVAVEIKFVISKISDEHSIMLALFAQKDPSKKMVSNIELESEQNVRLLIHVDLCK